MVIRNTFLIHDVSNALTTKLHDQASLQVDPKVVVTLSKSELVKPVSQSDSWRWKGEGVIRIDPDHPVKNIGVYLECKLFVNGIEPRKVQIVGKLDDGNEVSFSEEVYLEDGVVEGNVSLDVLHATWWPRYEFPVEVQVAK